MISPSVATSDLSDQSGKTYTTDQFDMAPKEPITCLLVNYFTCVSCLMPFTFMPQPLTVTLVVLYNPNR